MKYSYEKCKKFLEDLNFEFKDNMILTYDTWGKNYNQTNLEEIIDYANGCYQDEWLSDWEDVIYTLLRNNKDKLIEEE